MGGEGSVQISINHIGDSVIVRLGNEVLCECECVEVWVGDGDVGDYLLELFTFIKCGQGSRK